MFEHLIWRDDRLLYNGLVFRLEHFRTDAWELGDECFVFYKIKPLVDQYERFFGSREFGCERFFELGLWEGGSLAFWHETLRPAKSVGIDIADRSDSAYFRRYVTEHGLQDRVKTYWRVNQSDATRLKEIVRTEFDGPLDIVLDDASHVYEHTLNSFQTLFPMLRSGGLYIIEDWAWEHWPECYAPGSWLAREQGLSGLVSQLVQAAGTSDKLIKSVTVYQGFAAIERSATAASDTVALNDFIVKRPAIAKDRPMRDRVKRAIRRILPNGE